MKDETEKLEVPNIVFLQNQPLTFNEAKAAQYALCSIIPCDRLCISLILFKKAVKTNLQVPNL